MNNFFSWAEENIIIEAIRRAEKSSESEIRVHVDYDSPHMDTYQAAVKAFNKLGMHRTKNRNAVLIFLLPDRREFAIIGDIAIHEKVTGSFWDEVNKLIHSYFADARFVQGTCEAIDMIGVELRKYFPSDIDHNELPDRISYA